MSKTTALLINFCLLFAGAVDAAAQDTLPCRVPELQRLDFYPGSWQVRLEMRLSANGPWEMSDGTADVTAELGGCVFVERLRFRKQGKAVEALTIITWDQQNSRWQATFMDSNHGMQLLYEGSASDQRLDLRLNHDIGNRTVTLRRLFTLTTPRDFAWESSRLDNAGGWDVTGRARYSKAPK